MKKLLLSVLFAVHASAGALAEDARTAPALAGRTAATVVADVVAIETLLVYNRFGSFNPFGMIYALREDVVPINTPVARETAEECQQAEASLPVPAGALAPGAVRLRDCKRPRPLTVRVNVGDILEIRFENLLGAQPDISRTFCPERYRDPPLGKDNLNDVIWEDEFPDGAGAPGRNHCTLPRADAGKQREGTPVPADWPATRRANFAIAGLKLAATQSSPADGFDRDVCLGVSALPPGGRAVCRYEIDREGPSFVSSSAALAGGEGDGGSLTHGLFAAVIAEPLGSAWYRSQVSRGVFDAVWSPLRDPARPHARQGALDYEKTTAAGVPYLNMLRADGSDGGQPRYRLTYADLNAIVREPSRGAGGAAVPGRFSAFREFAVVFHDELKTFYTDAYKLLGASFSQLAGVRDGFGINYGASGMGAMLLANRKGIGPAADCVECLYEEFFLQSWANGDPALLEQFPDDPSNVHHSYLNDRVVFRNFHAGPKETHIFHLHAHQWFAGNDTGRGSYLDSQTIGPHQGFTYRIYRGGLADYADPQGNPRGWWDSHGAGNRNRAPGDSIFHCHLYPHFAQGMWELWRTHDVLEDGSRKLPDGQAEPGLSLAPAPVAAGGTRPRRTGSAPDGTHAPDAAGTPVPALVPLPDEPAPLLPTYGPSGMPGFPFYIAGAPGRRAPQPPLDMAVDDAGQPMDGGLPRHVIDRGTRTFAAEEGVAPAPSVDALLARSLAIGDFTAEFASLQLRLLPPGGTELERNAMAFHHDGRVRSPAGATERSLTLRRADGTPSAYDAAVAGYRSIVLTASPGAGVNPAGVFPVNGAPPRPGAPFADPCGAPDALSGRSAFRRPDGSLKGRFPVLAAIDDPFLGDGAAANATLAGLPRRFVPDPGLTGFRRYDVSAVQLRMVVNKAGWHDPQARINVLSGEAESYKNRTRADAEPFFFRARSGECIEFRHTNELPKDLARDDFQVATPTDTIGQHIHLVKFDVTASDGSGNGWNYEDGTFAPDEIVARICASRAPGGGVSGGTTELFGRDCARKDHWSEPRLGAGGKRKWFQTTVQRWFADPILSQDGAIAARRSDRTMRTVFTHDHFGPSSIQQHGFYSALIIEPQQAVVCPERVDARGECNALAATGPGGSPVPDPRLRVGDATLVGARKLVLGVDPRRSPPGDPLHPDVREFALAIADFALLYDPKAPSGADQHASESPAKGVVCLAKEAEALAGGGEAQAGAICAGGDEPVPASAAQYAAADIAHVAAGLRQAAIDLRQAHGRPIVAPRRPEAISVDHHDPYLVNYRHEPPALRVGSANDDRRALPLGRCGDVAAGNRVFEDVSIRVQREGAAGDLGHAFRSILPPGIGTGLAHGDPCTPIVESYDGERVQIRLIQGAQEVQHMFTVEGFTFRRNYDQRYPASRDFRSISAEASAAPTWWQLCHGSWPALDGRPRTARRWAERQPTGLDGAFWAAFERLIGVCDNVDGRVASQEIGISEHFEFAAPYRREGVAAAREFARVVRGDLAARRLTASDYLYHFGTLDAIWNGAWGLVRVHEGRTARGVAFDVGRCLARAYEEGPELAACLGDENLPPVDDRLTPLAEARTLLGGPAAPVAAARALSLAASRAAEAPARTQDPNAPARYQAPEPQFGVVCPPGAPVVRASAVALEASDLHPLGIVYHPQDPVLRDPDGRVLVLIPAEPVPDDRYPALGLSPLERDKAQLVAAAKNALNNGVDPAGDLPPERIRPFVLRINAGDCLDLTIFNRLKDDASDAPGDAPMPPIVPINVDTHDFWRDDTGVFQPSQDPEAQQRNLKPSSLLSLSLPLTATSSLRRTPYPAGINPQDPLAPTSRAPGSTRMFLYAGLVAPDLFSAIEQRIVGRSFCPADSLGAVRLEPFDATRHDMQTFVIDVLGRWYVTSGLPADEVRDKRQALARCILVEIASAEAGRPFFTPYAFGVVPLKPMGDVFNQLPHGLFGAVVVEPRGARYAGRTEAPLGGAPGTTAVTIEPARMGPSAQITLTEGFTSRDARGRPILIGPPRNPLREHVLFWQDGLALQARTNGGGWSPVADCHVCDDSYDFGKKGVSYRSTPLFARLDLRGANPYRPDENRTGERGPLNGAADLNAVALPPDMLHVRGTDGARTPIVLDALAGEEVILRLVHPGGRARQRAFVMTGNGYDDLLPGFGSPNAALLAPGKALTAAMRRPVAAGCHFWQDGPRPMAGHGVWGLLEVRATADGAGACPLAAAPR